METSWGRADPSSDKPKLARIEVVFIFEMVLTFETSTTVTLVIGQPSRWCPLLIGREPVSGSGSGDVCTVCTDW